MFDLRRAEPIASTWIALIAASLAGGCVFVPVEEPEPEPAPVETQPEPPPTPPEPVAAVSPPPAPPAETAPVPAPPEPDRVLVLLPAQADAFASVLPELEAQLSAKSLAASRTTLEALAADPAVLGELPPSLVIAVGSAATRAALDALDGPVVFCQVPDLEFEATPNAFGVASLPPLDLQLKAWRRLDPTLRTIGLVLGRDEALLAARVRRAAESQGLALELRLASSDREAVYYFKRMAADVDGLWLLPDNTVLSPRAIREMLDHAGARGVQTLVFTPSLLEWGALLSVTATDLDLAHRLADVVEVLIDGRADELARMTPLSELEARVNVAAAARLGLDPPRDVWIERSVNP